MVEQVHPEASHGLQPGDAVYGTTRGSLADRVSCKAGMLARAPTSLSMIDAAAMPTAYLTSYQATPLAPHVKSSKLVTTEKSYTTPSIETPLNSGVD